MAREWTRPPFRISTDQALLDLGVVHDYLAKRSYWALNMPRDLLEKAVRNSRCYGIYEDKALVGFGRVITDEATFGYLSDIFVLESHQGRGLGKWLVECMLGDPDLQGLRNWTLFTKDAQDLYARFGFRNPEEPRNVMAIKKMNPYGAAGGVQVGC